MQPVTVIATVLNEVQEIARLVPSLLGQVPPPAEVIIVDGGSTDGTWEWLLDAARAQPNLLPFRDESCNLKLCPGPISRGRNVAIAAAGSQIVACTDAGCTYPPDWLRPHRRAPHRLKRPIRPGRLLPRSAPILPPGIWPRRPSSASSYRYPAPSKSCTARSMAFRKDLWQRIGGFSEAIFYGEDTLFDLQARRLAPPVFVERRQGPLPPPMHLPLRLPPACELCRQRWRSRRPPRAASPQRCPLHGAATGPALAALECTSASAAAHSSLRWGWTVLPLVALLALQLRFAFHGDGARDPPRRAARAPGPLSLLHPRRPGLSP